MIMRFNLWPFGKKAAQPCDLPKELLSLVTSRSGQSVTVKKSLQVAAVLACVRVISEGVAQVPFKILQRQEDRRSKIEAWDHPLWDLLHRKPNDVVTSFGFRETLVMHAALASNGYAFINRSVTGKVLELINLEPGTCQPVKSDTLGVPPRYRIYGNGGNVMELPATSILHLRGPSWDGVIGMDVVKLAREAIGLSLATEEAHARLHSNGVKPGGMLSVEGNLNEEQHAKMLKWLEENYQGTSNEHRTLIMDRAAKFLPLAMTGVDSQHLETRRFQIEEVCRFFRVLPIMVCSQDKSSTYAGAEQNFLAHVVHTLGPWFERVEQTFDVQVLTDAERRQGYYTKLEERGLLRGALKDTAEFLYKLRLANMISGNEGREILDLNPCEGLDDPMTPINSSATLAPAQKDNANA